MNYYTDKRKVVLVGAGFVGMSFAFALMNSHVCDELGIIDIDSVRAYGEAMDLNHGLAFSGGNMKIYAAEYNDCSNADIVVICAGVAQRSGESRISLLRRNASVMESVVGEVCKSGFDGIFLIATNPVDVMSYVVRRLSGFPKSRVIGTGTLLDTARLRYLLGNYFGVDPRNIHAYVIGEHGDSEFIPWSQAYISTKSIKNVCGESNNNYELADLAHISEDVRGAAQKIIEAKKATYYGIGMAILRIVKAIFGNEKSVLTVSTQLDGEYGERGVYVGVPCVIAREGVRRVIELDISDEEREQLSESCDFLRSVVREMVFSEDPVV